VVHTMAERVRRRAAHGVGECAEMRRHFIEYTQRVISQTLVKFVPKKPFHSQRLYNSSSVRLWRDARRARTPKVFPTALLPSSHC
jgi:hypothetical protein